MKKPKIRHRGNYYIARILKNDHRLCLAIHGIDIARQVLDRILAAIPEPPTQVEEIALHAALEEDPQDRPTLLAYVDWLNERGRTDEALFQRKKAQGSNLGGWLWPFNNRTVTTLGWALGTAALCNLIDMSVLRGLRFQPWQPMWFYVSRAAGDHDLFRAWMAGREKVDLSKANGLWLDDNPVQFTYGW
jgi:uncharacterized protein (TIGR02996 family)